MSYFWTVPKSLLLQAIREHSLLHNEPRGIAAWIDDDQAFVAYYGFRQLGSFPLFHIDPRKLTPEGYGRLQSKLRVWAEPNAGAPVSMAGIEVLFSKGVVTVYGIGAFSRFAEEFDLTTGRALWRFSSTYWNTERAMLSPEEWEHLAKRRIGAGRN